MQLFENYGLSKEILKAIKELGYINPTPIQAKTIPHLLNSDRDLVGLAQTGTGKTAAFGLPILNQIDYQNKITQSIILSPTRELCVQIAKDMQNYAKYLPEIRITAVYGGASIENQIKDLRKGSQVVVGTPGRVLDLINRKVLKINQISFLVLDEADEMLNMGFKEDIDAILETTPIEKQTLLFSATMPPEIMKIASLYMHDPLEISVGTKNSGAENVEHFYYQVNAKNRYLALKRIADINPDIYGIVFCRTRAETQEVADKLIQDGYNADALHGDLSQAQRDHVMHRFRSGNLQLLVATDVAARGLDVNDLSHIINYNLPDEREIYIHRTGRTGRAGKKGEAITIIHNRELHKIREIEKLLKKPINRRQVPDGKEVCTKQLMHIIDRIEHLSEIDPEIDQFLPIILKKLSWLDRDELIKRFVAVEFSRFLTYYKNAYDLNEPDFKENKRSNKAKNQGKSGYTKFFLTLGAKDGLNKGKLLDLINTNDNIAGADIGKIEIMPGYTFFEMDSNYENEVIRAFNNKRYAGKRLKIEIKNSNKKEKPDFRKKDNKPTPKSDKKRQTGRRK
ncbi:MAG TPA: DEAD/DEAH box helicase [Bacteroidales bacterium]|mgnify:CR=1 FL=1|jgi:ATP-dependent RNA helicase DeaD|nr:DEAD/DEAH box helicase [Bacteroidales bacterium]HPX75643.1 DEAD/DEAH box helicase [Bacteroidales bacterium]HQB21583.1 DEAD/DEAH box helicase [Bacteroidales bacterium]